MRWRKLGHVFSPSGESDWAYSHASNPFAVPLADRRIRIYFSTRDRQDRSSIGWIELAPEAPARILAMAEEPALGPGQLGTFDDSGCSMGSMVRVGGRWYLYYVGWNLGVTVPWRNAIGLAVSDDGVEFRRHSKAPIVDRSDGDPFSLSYPYVLHDDGGWRMWYGSHLDWEGGRECIDHVIKSARSDNGIDWRRNDRVVLPQTEKQRAFARPTLLRDNRYRMWFSVRGDSYRIGYAESGDGEAWSRLDRLAGIDVSDSGWDSEMIEYPHVFDHSGQRYMLYNGNGYGRSGFGLAILERE